MFKLILVINMGIYGPTNRLLTDQSGISYRNKLNKTKKQHFDFTLDRWKWCWWHNEGESLKMLAAEWLCWWLSSLCWRFSKCKESVTNTNGLQHPSPTTILSDPECTFLPTRCPTQEKITGYLPIIYHKHNWLVWDPFNKQLFRIEKAPVSLNLSSFIPEPRGSFHFRFQVRINY